MVLSPIKSHGLWSGKNPFSNTTPSKEEKDSNKKAELEQTRKEEAYIQKIKGFYKLLALAIVNLVLFLAIALNNSDSEGWWLFIYMLITWIVLLSIYSFVSFDFFGEKWKKKMIKKKFT